MPMEAISSNTSQSEITGFLQRMKSGPAFLFLGQNYLRLETGTDPFLVEVLRKYRPAPTGAADYYQLLDSEAAASIEAALSWMQERCKRFSVPEWLKAVAGFAWSGVHTSAIDSVWPEAFRTPWREIHPLFEEKYKPSDPRNRFVLHCTFLFGSVSRSEEEERPPVTGFEWRKRRQVAVSLARRLPELVTPLGTLVLEGYSGNHDWFVLDDLLPILDSLGPNQTHIFSAADEVAQNADVQQLVKKGKLAIYKESLAGILLRGQEQGFIRLGLAPKEEALGHRIDIGSQSLTVPTDLWNQTSRSAIILDDATLATPPTLSQDARYLEFRRFLARTDGRPLWTAFSRGFAFSRRYENNLKKEVSQKLAAKRLLDQPVILHGQTGTGKTVALAALAYSIRQERTFPVLFIERRSQKPSPYDIDRFCQWAEEAGAPACLVVWDGMLTSEEYADFLRRLTGRGRKVVVVGSSYRIQAKYAQKSPFVLAPATLEQEEVEDFNQFLSGFHPSLGQLLSRRPDLLDETFLVALYRLLPATRSQIATGLSREIDFAEQEMKRHAAEQPAKPLATTALESALINAGLIAPEKALVGTTVVEGEVVDAAADLTGLVMVPGRFGIAVPLELLMRVMGKKATFDWSNLFQGIDIFQWSEDEAGNIEVGPRNRLEAELIVRARMGGARMEVAFARRLLLEVQERGTVYSDSREIDFAVDVVRSISGTSGAYFVPYLRDLAATLKQVREERGVENPRLILQEANLLRDWAIDRVQAGISDPSIDSAYSEAVDILRRALFIVGEERRNLPLRNFLNTELAATLASRALYMKNNPREAIALFDDARKLLVQSRIRNPRGYHPLDIFAWLTIHMREAAVLDPKTEVEAVADLLHAFQTADPNDFDFEQQEKFQVRRLEIARSINLTDMAKEAFEALEAQGSSAGYYLSAIEMSGLPETAKRLAHSDLQKLRDALQYLEDHKDKIVADGRCLDLQLELFWMTHTRTRIVDSERATIPLDQAQWRKCLEIINSVELTGASSRPLQVAFLRGLTLFHLGDTTAAFDTFREVERESDQILGPRRVIRSYLASLSSGQPQRFHGTVSWVSTERNRGEVYVDDLRRKVLFLPRDFGRPDISRGDSLGEFHIAFNFLGPLADPLSYYKS